jgi:5-methylcytosine-specific restriction endonuclease McrA
MGRRRTKTIPYEKMSIHQLKTILSEIQSRIWWIYSDYQQQEQQELRHRAANLKELIKNKEEAEARLAEKKKLFKAKRSHEKAIIASAQGKTRQAAEMIKSTLRKQIKQYPNCPYCDQPFGKNPHCDHIHPVSHGGLSTLQNMVYICSSCNMKKKDFTLREFINQNGLNRGQIEEKLITMGKRI